MSVSSSYYFSLYNNIFKQPNFYSMSSLFLFSYYRYNYIDFSHYIYFKNPIIV